MKKVVPIIVAIAFLASCKKEPQKEKRPPNIVFILADDLGWADLPNYGNTFNEAPNIEKLADQGVLFTNAYAANPVCSPTRASIQTGQYPARIGINDFLPGHWRPHEKLIVPFNKTQYLPLNYETIGEAMQKAGYATGYFGKWHLGHTQKHYPENQGYDESTVYNGGGFFDFGDKTHPKTHFPKGTVLSEALTNLSIDFIEKNKDKHFFLFLAHYDVHVQLDAQEHIIDKYMEKPKVEGYPSNAVYAAMIENLDTSVGRLMEKLKSLHLEDDTIVVFFSDNGGLVRRFDEIPLLAKERLHYYESDSLQYVASSNAPLRAEKGTVFEGGIREPFIVKWPGKAKAGSTSDALVSSIDLFPTFIAMANGKIPQNQVMDGKSIVPEIRGENQDTERAIFWHYPVYHHAVPASAVRKGDWKLIHFLDDDHVELYHLKEDIGETQNLALKRPNRTIELFTLLKNWRKNVAAAMPMENPDFEETKRHQWARHPSFDDMLNGAEMFKTMVPTN
ncbi:MAG: sulfatase [Saonia sp.]